VVFRLPFTPFCSVARLDVASYPSSSPTSFFPQPTLIPSLLLPSLLFCRDFFWGWIFARTHSLLAASASHFMIVGAGHFSVWHSGIYPEAILDFILPLPQSARLPSHRPAIPPTSENDSASEPSIFCLCTSARNPGTVLVTLHPMGRCSQWDALPRPSGRGLSSCSSQTSTIGLQTVSQRHPR
jgi:hypothetical protein